LVSIVLKIELMFYTRAYLKIEGGKRQGETPILAVLPESTQFVIGQDLRKNTEGARK